MCGSQTELAAEIKSLLLCDIDETLHKPDKNE